MKTEPAAGGGRRGACRLIALSLFDFNDCRKILKIANCFRRSKGLSINSGEYLDINDNEYFKELLEETPAALLSRITT